MKCVIRDTGEWLDINAGRTSQPRTSGVHLSGIIQHIARLTGRLQKDDEEELNGFSLPTRLRMALGLAWEDWFSYHLPHVEYHFGEICHDDILMTPDGLDINSDILYEFKLTWKSSKKTLSTYDRQWMWIAQNQGYLKPLGWRKVCQCVYFVNGDYTYTGPELYLMDIEYTQAEIDSNWKLMLQYRDAATPESHPPSTA